MSDFVPFDLAMKLKKKGYTLDTAHHYDDNGGIVVSLVEFDERCVYPCPEIHQVLKWLREEKDVDLVIYPIFIYKADDRAKEYHCKIYAPQLNKPIPTDEYRNRYESVALDGIKYVLDNLI